MEAFEQEAVRPNYMPDYHWTPAQRLINAGVIVRYTGQGLGVLMLHNLPGVFYNEQGHEVSAQIAKQAGYDTKILLEMKRKREAIAKVTAQVEHEFSATLPSREVVKEKNGYRMVKIGPERYNIEFGGTNEAINTKGPLDLKVAESTFEAITAELEPSANE